MLVEDASCHIFAQQWTVKFDACDTPTVPMKITVRKRLMQALIITLRVCTRLSEEAMLLTSCSKVSENWFISARAARQLPNERGSSPLPEENDAALNLPV